MEAARMTAHTAADFAAEHSRDLARIASLTAQVAELTDDNARLTRENADLLARIPGPRQPHDAHDHSEGWHR
jgi:cell division protein FtsB